jgi:hypothetical protein
LQTSLVSSVTGLLPEQAINGEAEARDVPRTMEAVFGSLYRAFRQSFVGSQA